MKQQAKVRDFIRAREWEQYHLPKELLLGLVEEIGEFRNIVKWEQDNEKVKAKIAANFADVEDFFGDVMFELCSLANYCGVDIETALEKVLDRHETRYPVDTVKGNHTNG